MKRCLVIAGMHRSGTSLAASAARAAGVDLGSELLPPGIGNPRGHFEDLDFLRFHDRLLATRAAGPLGLPTGWSPVLSGNETVAARLLVARRAVSTLWGFKDPRATFFLDQWNELLPEPFFLLLYRHPVEVALSLVRRGLDSYVLEDPGAAMKSWVAANTRLLEFHARHPERCLVWHASGMAEGLEPAFASLAGRLEAALSVPGLNALYEPAELQSGRSAPEIDWEVRIPEAHALWLRLEAVADLREPHPLAQPDGASRANADLRVTAERLLAASLRDRDDARAAARELAVRLRASEEAWRRLGETRGWRILQSTWSAVRRARVARHRLARNASRLLPRRLGVNPEDVLAGCVTENHPKYLDQTLRLLQSVRWFGGSLTRARFLVCAVEGIDPSARAAFETLGAEVRIVPRFDARNPFANKLQFFQEAASTKASFYLLLDCDTLVAGDPLPLLARDAFQAKIADLATVPEETLARVFAHYALALPRARYLTTFGPTATIRYCNSGVVAAPAELASAFVPVWRAFNLDLLHHPELLGSSAHHANQASLSLAFATRPVKFREAPVALNYPLHLTHLDPPREMLTTPPVILHYHDRVDGEGYLLPTPYPLARRALQAFNEHLRRFRKGEADSVSAGLFPEVRGQARPELVRVS